MSKVTGAAADPASLQDLLKGLRDLPPKVKRETRKELRTVGDDIIRAQIEILDGPLPEGTQKTGKKLTLIVNRRGRRQAVYKNTFEDRGVQRGGRSTGLRESIKSGLKTRIVTGKTRQGIQMRTTGPVRDDGFNAAKFWQKKNFRHPVFGNRDTYVYQQGQPYFFGPVVEGRNDLLDKATKILNDAIERA